jgi:lipopolysaccharide assembly outer membrane protein LptD (OstA)
MSGLIFLSAYINSQEFSYSSDKFLLDSEKNSLFFEGNVTLNFEEFIFNAEKAELDQTSEILKLESLSFKVKDQFVWGEAEKGAASKSKISFQKAKFSLCPCEEKIWWIEADEVDLDIIENNISFERGKLKINDRSVFYFPRGSLPASGGRRSGFLLPEISASNKSGTDISIPYYFNLASNYDFTFEPRYISKRGEGGFSEFRYLSKNYNGYVKTSFLSENSNNVNQNDNESFRWSLNFVHNAKFLNNYFLNINYSNLGDSLFLRDFGGGFNGQSDHLFVPQKITVANFGENYEFGMLVNAFKLTSPLGTNQYQEVPEIKLNYFFNYESFDFRLRTKYQSFRKGGSFFENSKDRVEKLKLEPEILFFKNFSQIDSMIKINYTFENFYLEKNKKSRILPKAELKLSKDLVKNKNDKMALLSPFFSFIYAKNKNQENLPNINSGFFLDSRSFSKDIVSGDSYIPMRRDILIGADYSLYEGKNKFNISFSKLFGLGKDF